jgi:hypothetical protein
MERVDSKIEKSGRPLPKEINEFEDTFVFFKYLEKAKKTKVFFFE